MVDRTPAELLGRYLDAFPDLEAVGSFLHPQTSFTMFMPAGSGSKTAEPGHGRTAVGRERILRGLAGEFKNFYRPHAFQLNVVDVFGSDDKACARYTITAETALGPYHNNYVVIARFDSGLIIEGWEYCDTMAAAQQLSPQQ